MCRKGSSQMAYLVQLSDVGLVLFFYETGAACIGLQPSVYYSM